MLIHTLTFGWIQQSILRFLSSYVFFYNITVNRFFTHIIMSSLIGTLLLAIVSFFYFHLSLLEICTIMIFLVLFNLYMFQLTLYQARFKSLKYAVNEIIYNVSMFIILCFFMITLVYKNYFIVFYSMIGGLILVELLSLIFFLRKFNKIVISKKFFNKRFFNQTFSYGIRVTIWLFISYIFNISDRFFIKEFIGYKEVGIYSSVYDIIFKIAGFTCMPVLLAYHPKIVEQWNKNNRQNSFRLIFQALKYEIFIFIVVCLIFFPGKDILYNTILKLNEGHLWHLTIPLIISAFLWQFAMLLHKPCELLFRLDKMITGILISLIVNIIANLIFIPLYGYQAAAYTTLVGVMVYIAYIVPPSGVFKNLLIKIDN